MVDVSVTTADVPGWSGNSRSRTLPLNGRSYDELLTLNPGVVNFTWEKTGGIGVSNSTVGNNFCRCPEIGRSRISSC